MLILQSSFSKNLAAQRQAVVRVSHVMQQTCCLLGPAWAVSGELCGQWVESRQGIAAGRQYPAHLHQPWAVVSAWPASELIKSLASHPQKTVGNLLEEGRNAILEGQCLPNPFVLRAASSA